MKQPRLKNFGPRVKPIDTRRIKPPEKVVESFYSTSQWKETAAAVRKRDGYKCVRCGEAQGRLYVDHIVERKDGGADYDHGNLETLCASHHTQKTHAEAVKRGQRQY